MSHPVRDDEHIQLFLPGPVEVRPEILDAQAQWMIGHRMPECAELIGSIEPKLQTVFRTDARVFLSASSGTGLWEAATRNCVRSHVLHCINGAFSNRWAKVSEANGKDVTRLEFEWGEPVRVEAVTEHLQAHAGRYDAIALAHNETSTGVLNPLAEIAAAVREIEGDDIMILVDAVSGLTGARLDFDAWDLDVALTSSQKAFALPPGLSFCAVSDRAMARAAEIPHRGYYFDFLTLERYLDKNQTPATPAISLLYALDRQLDDMIAETLEGRFARHIAMRDQVIGWARERGLECLSKPGFESPTVSCLRNTLEIDIPALNDHLRSEHMILSNGYGPLKGDTFRIGHMGDLQPEDVDRLLAAIDRYLVEAGHLASEPSATG